VYDVVKVIHQLNIKIWQNSSNSWLKLAEVSDVVFIIKYCMMSLPGGW